jgi:serine/threonine protein kinase
MEQLGKYRIEAKLGEGAMGFVYKAWHPGFNDYVALKTIQDTRLEGKELLDRFKLEGQALAKLKHQNIVQIYDADQASGVHFIVMEYMNGGSLDRIVSRRDASVPLAKRVSYMVPVCNALDYAHKRRLYHRDIKPANIMLQIDGGEEIVKVVDFGIARLVDSSQTQTKLLIGAPAYMAPELVTAMSKANEKTDIWAVGVTLYELIAYQRPFEGNSIEELTRNIVYAQPKPLTQIVPDCPKDLCAVVEKALQKDPNARYQAVEELLLDLEPIAKRLRVDFAGSLVRRAKELIEVEEFETAKSALDEAKRYHATNLEVRSLLQKVEDELRRGQLLPRLQEQVRVGRNFLTTGQYREARSAAEQAIGLDSRYEPAHKLLEEIQTAEAMAEEIQQKVTYAKRYVTEGELTQASKLVEDVLGIDPDNREASELSAKIRVRREELERRKKLSQFLRSADELLYTAKYEECLSLISEALREFPGNAELQKRKDNAQSEKGEQERLLLLNSARKLRTSQQYDDALEVLDELLIRFPGDGAGTTLRASIQKERDQEHLSKQLGQAWEDLRSLKIQGKIPEALALAKDLARKFPSEERIKEFARELEAETRETQIHNQVDATAKKIQELTRNGQFTQAIRAGEEALKQFPNNTLLVSLYKEAQAQGQREELLKRQANCLGRARDLLAAGQFKEAAELARKGLAEYGEHPGLRDVLAEAGRHEPPQAEKVRQQEAVATRIQESCDKGDFGLATRIFQDARKEGLIEENSPLHRTLLQHIEKAKDLGQKENAEQIDVKRQEVRQAKDRKAPPPKEPPAVEPAPRSVTPGLLAGKKWIIGAVGAAVLVLVVVGAVVLKRSGGSHPKDNDEIFWNNGEAAMSRSPRDFKEALAQYEKVSELEGAHHEQAHAKIHEIKDLQDEEEKLVQQAQQSIDKSPPDYPTAIGLYDQIIKIDGDRKADAEALRNRAEDLSKGLDIMVRAQQDFDSAEKLAAAGKWADARKQYDLVRKTPGISDELRTAANIGFKKADLHAKEEEFWKRAIAAENDKQLLDARGLFITVIGMGLNHKKDAEAHITEIDRGLAEAEAERKWAELKARFEQSRDSKDRNVLIGLRSDLGGIISGGGPHSGDAREYDRVVAETLARLDAEADWRRISDLYKQALTINDRASLIQIGERLKPFLNGGPHAEEARQYAENINRITSRPTLVPTTTDKSAIEQIAGQYAHDIQHKKIKDIKKIWPGISKEMEDQLQQFTNAHKIHSLEIHVEKLEPYGSGLNAICKEDMDYEEEGKRLKRSSAINFYMVKIQGNWKINGILVAKH